MTDLAQMAVKITNADGSAYVNPAAPTLAGALPAGTNNIGDVDVASIAAGNTVIGKVRPAYRMVQQSIVAVAAGNYTAGDVVSNDASADAGDPITFDAVVPAAGEVAVLDRIFMHCSEDSVRFRPRLHFFTFVPAAADVEMDDNVAFDIKTTTGAFIYFGFVDLPAFADRGTACAVTQIDGLRLPIKCDAADDALYVVIETLDDETNETAGMTIRTDLYFAE